MSTRELARVRSNEPTLTLTGGYVLAQMLELHDAGPLFGMGGFQLLPFYEGLRSLGLGHHLINDERCGAFAADAFARVTGRPGICDGTLGPGATNLVTGLVESLNAGVPILAITGNTHRDHSWKNMTQECRQTDILRPAVKELIRIETPKRIPELVRRAYSIATSGRPGPVLLDVPEDVCHGEATFATDELHADPAVTRAPSRRIRPADEDVTAAAGLLARAKRPLLLVGGGVHLSRAYHALEDFARTLAVPIAYTMSGKGAIACTDPLSVGLFGRYSRIANDLIASADCLLVVGCKLGEIATMRYRLLPPGVPIVHLDIVAEEIGRTAHPYVTLWGDALAGLEDLLAALHDSASRVRKDRREYLAEIPERMAKWRNEARRRLESDEQPIDMARLCAEINRVLPPEATLVADGGFAAHWTALFCETKRSGRSYIADRGLTSIGYGVPGCIGAQLGAPDAPVVGLTGDGGFNMTLGELETARRLGTPFVLIVVNNAASGYVKALQHALYGGGKYQSSDLVEIDYARVAQALGCHGVRVEDPGALAGALDAALRQRDLPTVVDVVVTRDPAKMLPAIDSRTLSVAKGDRPA
jgi:acetolactate synthase-1/2/3 large subunit